MISPTKLFNLFFVQTSPHPPFRLFSPVNVDYLSYSYQITGLLRRKAHKHTTSIAKEFSVNTVSPHNMKFTSLWVSFHDPDSKIQGLPASCMRLLVEISH